MADLCNIGTLSAFMLVCAGVLVTRRRDPHRERPFRTPWVPLVPILGILGCLYLILGLPPTAWIRFAAWLVIGLVLYFLYGWKRSAHARQ
jgi:APA family basic amino acid/polyamine antiporter